jgi:hypothetical protein
MANLDPKGRQGYPGPSQAHAQHPVDRHQLAQPLGLICLVNTFWIVTKGSVAGAAAVTVHLDIPITIVSYGFLDPSPTLKGLTGAITAFLRTIFCFSLDIWQSQDDNRHGELRCDGGVGTTILLGACLFGSKPTAFVTDTFLRGALKSCCVFFGEFGCIFMRRIFE